MEFYSGSSEAVIKFIAKNYEYKYFLIRNKMDEDYSYAGRYIREKRMEKPSLFAFENFIESELSRLKTYNQNGAKNER